MRILFCARHFGAFRNYEPAICRLAEHGHEILLTGDVPDVLGGQALVERLAAAYPGVRCGMTPSLAGWPWLRLAETVRNGLEAVRFADPAYDRLPKYRHRSTPKAPWFALALSAHPAGRRVAGALLRAIERGIPAPPALSQWMHEQAPDVVLLASVTNDGAPQMDHLKAARALGVPVSLPIYSWDHLSGKAVLHIPPSQVLTWNELQRTEAVELHGLPASIVDVTGAYGYEPWMSCKPSQSRVDFCAGLGLDPAKPVLVYVCSVLSRPAPPEAPFVLEWVRAIRRSVHPLLREAGIVIRPHPERASEWSGVSLEGLGAVAVSGRNPIDAHAKAEYFDTLYHAAAVVGIVTSASIEAAVVGRPALAVEPAEFREHQDGAPHYHYLRDPEHGLLVTAADFETHLRHLVAIVDGDGSAARRAQAFVDRFVRPPGGQRSASEVFAAAVERLGAAGRQRPVRSGTGLTRLLAECARGASEMPGLRRLLRTGLERAADALEAERGRNRDRRAGERDARQAAEDRERDAREQAKAIRVKERAARVDAKERDRAALKRESARQREERRRLLGKRVEAREAERRGHARRRRWRTLLRRLRLGA